MLSGLIILQYTNIAICYAARATNLHISKHILLQPFYDILLTLMKTKLKVKIAL
jgi:hypothetical protein